MSYHDADVVIGQITASEVSDTSGDDMPHDDPRWPLVCSCGYGFAETDEWQFNRIPLYRRSDNGELITLRRAPVGAMWFAPWMSDNPEWQGPDGQTLVVQLPGNHGWIVDSRCSNCGSPQDNVHKCWVRHGVPPDITVDKNGHTCNAGAGSIAIPGWHGFLQNGYLVD